MEFIAGAALLAAIVWVCAFVVALFDADYVLDAAVAATCTLGVALLIVGAVAGVGFAFHLMGLVP